MDCRRGRGAAREGHSPCTQRPHGERPLASLMAGVCAATGVCLPCE